MGFHDHIISSFDVSHQSVFILHVDVEFFFQSLMNMDPIYIFNKYYLLRSEHISIPILVHEVGFESYWH